jgi:hypothetical protein
MKKPPLNQYDRRYLRLLQMAPFERRRGGWRFGTNRLADDVVERLLEAEMIERDGDRIVLARNSSI